MNKLENVLRAMKKEQYELVVGTGHSDALSYAFRKKRVVHPQIASRPYSPKDAPRLWQQTMAQTDDSKKSRAAYIHIPFCSHMCLYCGFFQNYADEERETFYVDYLIKELAMAKKSPYVQSGLFQAVFFGGGTPSALSPKNAARLLQAVRDSLPLSCDCEITFEGRVNDLADDKISAWFDGGVNRVSIGVQSFDTKLRQAMGRIDSLEEVKARLENIAAYNQAAIIIDLIFGLPTQDEAKYLADLAIADALPIDGMDLYQLNLFDISPLKKAIDSGKIPAAATTAEQARLFAAAEKWLTERAYKRLSNCHWAKNNRERSQYNTLTKQGAEVFPFGAGAGGNVGGKMLFLQRDINAYAKMLDNGFKPLMVLAEQPSLQAIYNLVMRQMEMGYINLNILAKNFGEKVTELLPLIDIWEKNGLVKKGAELIWLTQAGRFWQMNLTQSIMECIELIFNDIMENEVQRVAEQG